MINIKAFFQRILLLTVWSVVVFASVARTPCVYGDESRKDFKTHLREFKESLAKEDISKAEESLSYLLKIYGDKKGYLPELNTAGNEFRRVQTAVQKKGLQKGVSDVRRFMADGRLSQADTLVEDLRQRYPDADVIGYLDREVQSKKYAALQYIKGKMDTITKLIDQNKDQEALSQTLQLQASQKYIPPSYQQDLDMIVKSIRENKKPVPARDFADVRDQPVVEYSGADRPVNPTGTASEQLVLWDTAQKNAGSGDASRPRNQQTDAPKAAARPSGRQQDTAEITVQSPSSASPRKSDKPPAWQFWKRNKKEPVPQPVVAPMKVKVFKSVPADSLEMKRIELLAAEKKWDEAKALIRQTQNAYPDDPQLQELSARVARQEVESQQRRKALEESLQRASSLQGRSKLVDEKAVPESKKKVVLQALQEKENQRYQATRKSPVAPDKQKQSMDKVLQQKREQIKVSETRAATALFMTGKFDEAQQKLEPLCAEYPHDRSLKKLYEKIQRKREVLMRKQLDREYRERQQGERYKQDTLRRVERLISQRKIAEAEAALEDTARRYPSDPKVMELKNALMARDTKAVPSAVPVHNPEFSAPADQADSRVPQNRLPERKLTAQALEEKSVYVKKIYQEAQNAYKSRQYDDTIRLCTLVIKLEKSMSSKYTPGAQKLIEKAQKQASRR